MRWWGSKVKKFVGRPVLREIRPPDKGEWEGVLFNITNYRMSDTKFISYNTNHINYARYNRNHSTHTEKIVRKTILSERPQWYKFTRQKPLWSYIADFYCSKLLLAVEIDDAWHDLVYDTVRDHKLQQLWIKTIRYTNDQVMSNWEAVAIMINQEINIREQELGLVI